MNINDFVEKYRIKVEDVKKSFTKINSKEIDASNHEGCLNCDNPIDLNQFFMPSEPWTTVQISHCCKTINVLYHTDRMSGNDKDLVETYKENKQSIENLSTKTGN